MNPPTRRLMKDSDFSFFDSLASVLIAPYFVCTGVTANDNEFGFDPHPSMASLPEYVSISTIYDGGSTRSQAETQKTGPFQKRVKLTKSNKTSPWKHGDRSSSLEACEEARAYKNVSSLLVRHGQITPPTISSVFNKAPEVVERSARHSASSRKSHDSRREVGAVSASVVLVSTSSNSDAKSITKSSRATGRNTKRLRTPLRLLDDRKRKLSLDKNRIAAANCRVKKQKKEDCLQAQSRELVSNNTILKQSVSDMTQDLWELRSMLQFHVLSADCYAPAHIQNALGEERSHGIFSSVSPCDDDGSESMRSLCRDRSTPDFIDVPDMVVDDWYRPDMPLLEGSTPLSEYLLPMLDLTDGLETKMTPDSVGSIYCDAAGS